LNSGISVTWVGMTSPSISSPNSAPLPRKRNLAKPYPASVQMAPAAIV